MLTPRELSDMASLALSDLGQNPSEIIRSRGHKGDMSACSCPIQKYLTEEVPLEGNYRWYVSRFSAAALDFNATPESPNRTNVRVELPTPVVNFIEGFDSGEFPDLILPDDE